MNNLYLVAFCVYLLIFAFCLGEPSEFTVVRDKFNYVKLTGKKVTYYLWKPLDLELDSNRQIKTTSFPDFFCKFKAAKNNEHVVSLLTICFPLLISVAWTVLSKYKSVVVQLMAN